MECHQSVYGPSPLNKHCLGNIDQHTTLHAVKFELNKHVLHATQRGRQQQDITGLIQVGDSTAAVPDLRGVNGFRTSLKARGMMKPFQQMWRQIIEKEAKQ
jgi:hypothetical protein